MKYILLVLLTFIGMPATIFAQPERLDAISSTYGNSHIPWTDGNVILTGTTVGGKFGGYIFRTYEGTPYGTVRFYVEGSTGNVGINSLTPVGKLEVYESLVPGPNKGDSRIITTIGGATGGGNHIKQTLWTVRDDNSTANWMNTRLHDAITIDGSFYSPGQTTKTWWERDPFNDIQSWGNSNNTYLTINGGNVGIGTTDPKNYKLAVNGIIGATSIKVTASAAVWPDYVFANSYKIRSLSQVEAYIKANKHLPEVPSAEEVEKEGLNLGEMDALLLKKIEELTLYMIELKKENEKMELVNQALLKDINNLKTIASEK